MIGRRLALFAAAVAVAGALSGCRGDDDGSTTGAPPVTPTTSSTTTTTEAPATTTTVAATVGTTAPPGTTARPTTTTARPAGATGARPPRLRADLVAEFAQPLALAPVPGRAGTFFVAEKEGRVRHLVNGSAGPVVLDIVGDVSSGGERGLLGLAVSPAGRHVYLDYTDRSGDTRVVEYAIGEGGSIDGGSRRELLFVDQPYANHNGGHLAFGADGFLYIAMGDGGGGGDPQGHAQNLGSLLGKILRIDPDPDGGGAYAIPPGNPFASRQGARPEIWSFGLRNPWRFSLDRTTGRMWIGDVGQNEREEVDRSPGTAGGENYGWDRFEGTRRFEGTEPLPDHVGPVYDYARADGACAVTGGYVYRGAAVNALWGWYVFGDFCRGELVAIASDVDARAPGDAIPLGPTVPSLASFAEDAAGELYALSLQGGVYRLVAA